MRNANEPNEPLAYEIKDASVYATTVYGTCRYAPIGRNRFIIVKEVR